MVFEWDNNKNEYNIANHDGISFEFAIRVFLDEKRIEKKRKEHIRIISARKATKEEINEYYNNYNLR